MHKVRAKGILSASNGMNLYRGCLHGCIYCDSRSMCYQFSHPFEDIEVKENGPELLAEALRRKRKKCMIGTGSMSDPYLPLERELCLTRKTLEVIRDAGFGATVLTKSDLILRDLDLLSQINDRSKAVVQMTLTTIDDRLCRILEPNVSVTSRRIEALRRFRDAGIPTVVWLCPILPFINDTEENIRGILDACREVGVRGIMNFGMGVTLRDGSREYFYSRLDRHFPGLKERYIRTYGNAYELPSPRADALDAIFRSFCKSEGILHHQEDIFRYLGTYEEKNWAEQISLF